MDGRKQELSHWLNELEQYAKENNLSGRIMDGIVACREKINSDNVEMDQLRPEVEGVLNSIQKKTVPGYVNSGAAGSNIMMQDVKVQVKKMAQRCHEENEKSVQELSERRNITLKKCAEQLKEITNTEVHLEEITNGAGYIQFYEKKALDFEKEASYVLSEMFEAMNENYTHMMEHMRSLFRRLRESGVETIREKDWYEADAKRAGIGRKIQTEAESWKTGRQEIISFAQRTGKKIGKIVRTEENKRRLCGLLPILLVVFLGVGNLVCGISKTSSDAETTQAGAVAEQSWEWLMDVAGNCLEKADTIILAGVSFVGIAAIMIIVLLYRWYLKWLKRNCNRTIAKKSAEYLQTEFVVFEQSNCLRLALDESVKMAAEGYEQQNLQLLNELFAVWDSGQHTQKDMRLEELIAAWNNIRLRR